MDNELSRRSFLKVMGIVAGGTLATTGLAACSSQPADNSTGSASEEFDPSAGWDAIVKAADGQTCNLYMWGGSETRNEWIDTVVADALKEKYNVTLNRVPMSAPDFLTQLSGEIQAGTEEGSIDVMWINGENFYSAKENGYLYGPIAEYCPNFEDYVDGDAAENLYDFGAPIEGYETPYGKAQMQMWCDTAVIPESDFPADPDAFLAFCQKNAGKVTYPEPGDFTGTAFIECLIAGVIGKDEFEKLASVENDKDAIKKIIQPGLDYLVSLNPYLWNAGATFPADSETVGTMFADGELVMNMGYGSPDAEIEDGSIPDTVRSFVFETGTVGNSNFHAVAANATNKAAAIVFCNEIMDPEIQLSQYDELSTITVLDLDKLSSAQQQAFADVKVGVASLPSELLLAHRVAEAPGAIVPTIEEIWHEEVVGK